MQISIPLLEHQKRIAQSGNIALIETHLVQRIVPVVHEIAGAGVQILVQNIIPMPSPEAILAKQQEAVEKAKALLPKPPGHDGKPEA